MNSKHEKTLVLINTRPPNGNIEWRKIEALFLALGAKRLEGSGSAVTFILNNVRVSFHRPHPDKIALRYRVIAAQKFLKEAGVL